jgi:tetratricopeptide (TPR) repeat protein
LEYSQSALSIAQNIPDSELKNSALLAIAQAYMKLGFAYNAQKQYSEAMTAFHQALDFAQQAGDRHGEFNTLQMLTYSPTALAREFIAAEEFQQASAALQQGLEYGQQALTLAQNDEQKRKALGGLWTIYASMGQLYDAQEEYPKAIEAYQQGLAVTRQLGDRSSEATTLVAIAGYYSQLSQYRQALELQQQSLAIVREIGDPSWEVVMLISIGKTYGNLGQYSQTREHYQQALAIAVQQGALIPQVLILNNLGTVAIAQGEYAGALEHLQQALPISQEVHRRLPTETPDNLAQLCTFSSRNNQTSESPAYLVDQVIENQRNGCLELTRSFEAKTLNNIGYVYDS